MDLHNPSAWRSYDQEPLSSDQDSRDSGTLVPVPKFDVDPEVPLETMVALDSASDQSGEPDTDHMKHNTGWYFCIILVSVVSNDFLTLVYQIKVQVQINMQVGELHRNDKRRGETSYKWISYVQDL